MKKKMVAFCGPLSEGRAFVNLVYFEITREMVLNCCSVNDALFWELTESLQISFI